MNDNERKKTSVGENQTYDVTAVLADIYVSFQRSNLRVCKKIIAPKVKFRDEQRELPIKNPVLTAMARRILLKRKLILTNHYEYSIRELKLKNTVLTWLCRMLERNSTLKDHSACRQRELPIKNPVSTRTCPLAKRNSTLKDHYACRQRELKIKNPVLKRLEPFNSKTSKREPILISQNTSLGEHEEVTENLFLSQKNCEIESNTGYIKRP